MEMRGRYYHQAEDWHSFKSTFVDIVSLLVGICGLHILRHLLTDSKYICQLYVVFYLGGKQRVSNSRKSG